MFTKIISAKRALGLLVLFSLFAGILSCASNTAGNSGSTEVKGTRGYPDERFKPAPPYNGPQRTGAVVYADYCATCHDRTTQGAPLPDDDIEWARRLNKQSQATLVKHVMEGYKELMPKKGGCRNCTDQEVLLAIDFIYKSSGIKLDKPFAK
ncbi:MAG TPA: cytochrome c5 family protein [Gammaproteobacteria bacterium]|nr:cytochrome c5 family protein [Gammaproteobacteria bacterium]